MEGEEGFVKGRSLKEDAVAGVLTAFIPGMIGKFKQQGPLWLPKFIGITEARRTLDFFRQNKAVFISFLILFRNLALFGSSASQQAVLLY